ncbi:MAG: protein phosphatase 2C domain-containing protein [Pirellulales bacterium]
MTATNSSNSASRTDWKITVRYSVLSDIGMRRAVNQDSASVIVAETQPSWERHGHLFLVADGMGAHAAGEMASRLAADLIPHQYMKQQETLPVEALRKAVTEANAEIYRRGQANIEFRNMGTTASMLTLLPEGAVLAHVGDSRVYQLHGDQLYQLTFDHSLVWEMQAAGEVTDETARSGVIPKNVITRSLGPNANVQVDLEGPFPVAVGDRFLLCSDGLSGQISDEEIGAFMKVLPPDEASQLFIDLSNLRGGPDNITAIVVEIADISIATEGAGTPFVRKEPFDITKFSTVLAVVTAVCFLAALILAVTAWQLAIVAAVLGVIALLTGLLQIAAGRSGSDDVEARYGKGPYRSWKAQPGQALFEHLAGTIKALREAADERNWKIDWANLEDSFRSSRTAADSKDYAAAVRLQSNVIIALMKQIRKQRNQSTGDSSVDL